MPAYRVIITPRAAADLEAIYDYIALDSASNASRMITTILNALEPLKEFPHRYVLEHKSNRLRNPVRSLPVVPYIIYFRVLELSNIVRVLTVRHGARRQPRRL